MGCLELRLQVFRKHFYKIVKQVEKMAITIVIPVYGIKEEYLRKCLDSVLGQTDPNWEAILVDDGSPDRCGEICEEYAEKDPRFVVYHQENQGVSVARNKGIDCARYEWVTFVDPDDWIEESAVENINAQLTKNNPDILAFGYAREFRNTTKPEFLLHKTGKVPADLLREMRLAPLYHLRIQKRVWPYTINAIWNKVYKVSFLNQYHIRFEVSAKKGQDRVFNLYALDKSDQVYYMDRLLYHYRNDNQDSIVNRYNPNTIKNSQAVLKLMFDWIEENHKPQIYTQMLYCWICTRLQEYMRLFYFHKSRNQSYRQVKQELDALLASEPYKTAFEKVDNAMLSRQEKIFLFFIRTRQYWVCRELISLREDVQKRK